MSETKSVANPRANLLNLLLLKFLKIYVIEKYLNASSIFDDKKAYKQF